MNLTIASILSALLLSARASSLQTAGAVGRTRLMVLIQLLNPIHKTAPLCEAVLCIVSRGGIETLAQEFYASVIPITRNMALV